VDKNYYKVLMQNKFTLFIDRLFFSELVARSRKELHCDENEDHISVVGVLHIGFKDSIIKKMISSLSEYH
jgi:hypothetical protein